MKRNGILNLGLSQAIAGMGHTDLMIVCDAGFPIPSDVPRVDLALVQDVPDLATVLKAIAQDFIVERVVYAAEMGANNPRLLEKVQEVFAGADFGTLPHEEILGSAARQAKVIVRTGAYDPWGNILLYSGVDAPKWFSKEGTIAPEYYARKMKQ